MTAKQIKNELDTIKAAIRDIEIDFNVVKTKNQRSVGTQELREHIEHQKARLYGQASGYDDKPINRDTL